MPDLGGAHQFWLINTLSPSTQ